MVTASAPDTVCQANGEQQARVNRGRRGSCGGRGRTRAQSRGLTKSDYEHMLITVMPRPCCQRRVGCRPDATYFKPAGAPLRALEEVVLTLDELEALRLADFNGQYQEQAAEQMKISRATFARIVESARKKVADALLHGKALRIEGGPVVMKGVENMPAGQGQGRGQGGGMGRGPCGCGMRRGGGGPGGRGGAPTMCVCPQCGERAPHTPGEPCAQKSCPKCGTRMTRA